MKTRRHYSLGVRAQTQSLVICILGILWNMRVLFRPIFRNKKRQLHRNLTKFSSIIHESCYCMKKTQGNGDQLKTTRGFLNPAFFFCPCGQRECIPLKLCIAITTSQGIQLEFIVRHISEHCHSSTLILAAKTASSL